MKIVVIFYLRKVLHVLQITKNLISISKFTKDNDVFIEFHPSFCLIKDLYTKILLLQAKLTNGLYSHFLHLKLLLGNEFQPICGMLDWGILHHPLPSSSNKLSVSFTKLNNCEGCHMAK